MKYEYLDTSPSLLFGMVSLELSLFVIGGILLAAEYFLDPQPFFKKVVVVENTSNEEKSVPKILGEVLWQTVLAFIAVIIGLWALSPLISSILSPFKASSISALVLRHGSLAIVGLVALIILVRLVFELAWKYFSESQETRRPLTLRIFSGGICGNLGVGLIIVGILLS